MWYFKKAWWERAAHLRVLTTPAAGKDWIEEPEGPPRARLWFGTFHGPLMAESVLGAALYFTKAFPLSVRMQQAKKWARAKISSRIGTLQNARVTVYGFGRIGQELGRVFKFFGARITGIRRHPASPPGYFDTEDRLLTPEAVPRVFPETDHLILTLPGGPASDGVITLEALRLLSGARLYNVGRGNPYREEDLLRALEEKHVREAYLDVFATEPLPEQSPLWGLETVLLQPHLSAAAPQYLDRYVEELIARLRSLEEENGTL